MTSRGRSYTQTQASERDSFDDFNDYDPQYSDQHAGGSVSLDQCRLYVTNIPKALNDVGLKGAFSKFGTLSEVYLSRDPKKKYGLVRFETPGEAKLAMMKLNKTEPLRLNISIAHKPKDKKADENKPRREWVNRSNSGHDRSLTRDDSISIGSRGRTSRAPETTVMDTTTNGDNNMDDLLDDDYGFSDILDPTLTLELENLKMEQLKIKEEQLMCKTRMLMLKKQDSKMPHTTSNRCILPDGKIVVRNVNDRNADLDMSHSAGAGDSRVPALQHSRSRACVWCGAAADAYCARCSLTPYCSPRCQARDWAERHRAVCHNLARLSNEAHERGPSADSLPAVQNPAPLRRPHTYDDERQRPQRRDDDNASKLSDHSNKSERFKRLQQHGRDAASRSPYQKKEYGPNTNNQHNSPRIQNQYQNKNNQQRHDKPNQTPAAQCDVTPDAPAARETPHTAAPAPVANKPQVNGTPKPESPAAKPASLGDVTPTRKLVPKNYLVELLSVGDMFLASVDAAAAQCGSARGDYVCLSMHDSFERAYNTLCEDYVLACDADKEAFKPSPGDVCSYYNEADGAWYRARCLSGDTLALLDGSKLVTMSASAITRRLSNTYENVPEFSCLLHTKNVQLGENIKCLIQSKSDDGYKITMQNFDTGDTIGEGLVTRWIPTVEYPPAKSAPAVIPEVPRPPVTNNSRVLLVDATALDRAFVRPADTDQQRKYDDIVENVLLAGRKATPLKEPPQRGQTVIAKFVDGLHYRALCKRTNVAQNKYLLEYTEYGNMEVCRNLSDMFPCPPHLELSAAPSQVCMVKLATDATDLTAAAKLYVEKLKDANEEMILTLSNGETSAPSGSEVTLKVVKTLEVVNKKIIEMCTPEWKKLEAIEGDALVREVEPLMYSDVEFKELPPGPVELDILDLSVFDEGTMSGCVKGDPYMDHVFNYVTEKMAAYCNSELGREPYLPKLEELCIAQCPPYPQWFRAVVMEQLPGPGGAEVRVCYLDYGNVSTVPVALLRKMLPEFVRAVPALVSTLQIKDFPKAVTPEQLSRAAEYLQVTEEGRGTLRVQSCVRREPGMYEVEAPGLVAAMMAVDGPR